MRPITAEEKKIALEAAARVVASSITKDSSEFHFVRRTIAVAKEFEKHLAEERYGGR